MSNIVQPQGTEELDPDLKLVANFWSRGPLEFRFLSNFYSCPVVYKDILFNSSEHAYQWARIPENEKGLFTSLDCFEATASEVKVASKQFPVIENWDSIKHQVMLDVIKCKFDQNKELRKKLMRLYLSGFALIHKVSWNDLYWGHSDKDGGLNMQGIIIEKYAFDRLIELSKINELSRVINKSNTSRSELPSAGIAYIGRPSKFGNPYVLATKGDADLKNRFEAIRQFAQYLSEEPQKSLIEDLLSPRMQSSQFSCFCAPKACHGDVLAGAQFIAKNMGISVARIWLKTFSDRGYLYEETAFDIESIAHVGGSIVSKNTQQLGLF